MSKPLTLTLDRARAISDALAEQDIDTLPGLKVEESADEPAWQEWDKAHMLLDLTLALGD